MPKFPKNKGYKSPVKHTGKGKGNHTSSQTHGDISFHHHKNLGGGPYKDNWTVVMEQKASKGFTDKPDKKQIEALKKPTATAYAPFKMKHADGNPMKANFKSAFKQMDPMTPQPQNIVNPAAPMQKHDGKKFEDAGFMDTHFPSGKPRTPAKQLDGKESKIVKKMKKIEAKLAKNGSLSAEKKKKLKDELLKLSTTSEGQRYTDTGGISPTKKNGKIIKPKKELKLNPKYNKPKKEIKSNPKYDKPKKEPKAAKRLQGNTKKIITPRMKLAPGRI